MAHSLPIDEAVKRGYAIAEALRRGEVITSKWVRDKFGVSHAQAKRYMTAIEVALPVRAIDARNNQRQITMQEQQHRAAERGIER